MISTTSRFTKLPNTSSLGHFLSRHDDSLRSGLITRLDRSPVAAKRVTFVKAFILNVVILSFVVCIATVSFLRECSCISTALSLPSKLIVWAVQEIAVSFAIFKIVRTTTIPFFFGECRLRLTYGFRPSEVIIRKPPTPTVMAKSNKEKSGTAEDQHMEHYWRTATRAIDPKLLYSNANAILSSEYWTLEYAAVFDALQCISAHEFDEEALEFAIWKQNSENVWTVCELWRMHEIMSDQQEVAMFKTFLTQSGKEVLLSVWEDMMLNTSSGKPVDSLAPPKSYQAMVDRFAQEGLDYDTVWSHVSEKTQPSS